MCIRDSLKTATPDVAPTLHNVFSYQVHKLKYDMPARVRCLPPHQIVHSQLLVFQHCVYNFFNDIWSCCTLWEGSSSVIVRPCLNLSNHLQTIAFEDARFPSKFTILLWISIGARLFFYKMCIRDRYKLVLYCYSIAMYA